MTDFHSTADPAVIEARDQFHAATVLVERQLDYCRDAVAKEKLVQAQIHAETLVSVLQRARKAHAKLDKAIRKSVGERKTSVTAGPDGRPLGEQGKPGDPLWD